MSSGLRNAAMNGPTTPPRGPAASSAAAARCAALSSASRSGGIRSRPPVGLRVLRTKQLIQLRHEQDLARGATRLELAMRVRDLRERKQAVDPRPQCAEREPREQIARA